VLTTTTINSTSLIMLNVSYAHTLYNKLSRVRQVFSPPTALILLLAAHNFLTLQVYKELMIIVSAEH
jgi:hypothetical protein